MNVLDGKKSVFVNTTGIQNVIRDSYKDNWPDPSEFVFRGMTRSRKEWATEYALDSLTRTRKDLNDAIRRIAQLKMPAPEENSLYAKEAQQESVGICSRFWDWLNGSERDARLSSAYLTATKDVRDAELVGIHLDVAISELNDLRQKHLTALSTFYACAYDAHTHNNFTKCGWTWWR